MKKFAQLFFEFTEFDYQTAINNNEPIDYYKDNKGNYFGLHVNTEHMMENDGERLVRFQNTTFPNDMHYKAFLNKIHSNKELVINALQHIPTLPIPDNKSHKYVCVMFFQPFIYHMTADLSGRMNPTIEDEFNDIKVNFPDKHMIINKTDRYVTDNFYVPFNKMYPKTSHQNCIEIVLKITGNVVKNKLPFAARKQLKLTGEKNFNKVIYDIKVNTITKPSYPNEKQGLYNARVFGYVWNNPNVRNIEPCFVTVNDESMFAGFKDL